MVPKLIHITWLPGWAEMPVWARANVARMGALNPDRAVVVWDAGDIEPYLTAESYREVWRVARKVGPPADVARYAILEAFGGWYLDVDVRLFQPLPELDLHGRLAMVGPRDESHRLSNWLLACERSCAAWPSMHRIVADAAPLAANSVIAVGSQVVTQLAREHPAAVHFLPYQDWCTEGGAQLDRKVYLSAVAGDVEMRGMRGIHGWATGSTRVLPR